MKTPTQSTLSKWILWAPLKFAAFTFIACFIALLISYGLGHFMTIAGTQLTTTMLTMLALISGVIFLIKKLPATKMNKFNFISLYNLQLVTAGIASVLFTLIIQFLPLSQMLMTKNLNILTILFISALIIGYLYLFGVSISNLYASYMRARELGISRWKIICSFPFGFSMLWTAGYLLNTKEAKKQEHIVKSPWYLRIMNWTVSKQANTISAFIIITCISALFYGLNSIPYTFIGALIFGIWATIVGQKKMAENIGRGYATMAIILNFALIIAFVIAIQKIMISA